MTLSVSQSFQINTASSRISALFKTLSSSITMNQVVYRSGILFKSVVTGAFTTDSINRIYRIQQTITDSIYVSAAASRIQSLVRLISQSFSMNELLKRIWFNYSKYFCYLMGDEESCAGSGCYWCTGTCSPTTCPSPITPPSGPGGGGGIILIPPTNITNATLEEMILDTNVHVETPEVNPGDKVYALVTLLKAGGPKGVVNVNISYQIKDTLGNALGVKKIVVGVETIRSDIYYLAVPISAPSGTYTFEVLAQYDNATDYSFGNFQVINKLIKPSITIKRVDVPFILINENTTIKAILENLENRKIDSNVTLLLPYGFVPQNTTKLISLNPLSEEVIEFTFSSQKSGSFTGFIKVEYENNEIVKDFDIEVYAPEKFLIFLINNYWWIIVLALIALLVFFIYRKRDKFKRKEKVNYVFKRKDLLP
jgi:hypothetical protein